MSVEGREADALDAYSEVVSSVAAELLAKVASLRVGAPRPTPRGGAPGSGSAVALSADGLFVTSAHVVRRAEGGEIVLHDGTEGSFRVIGADPLSDLAVVQADTAGVQPAELGDADGLQVGQLVVAIGSPLGYAGSVSAGVVSGLGRSLVAGENGHSRLVENVVQTDAALHPGNSGGALADARARVVGINTAVVGPHVGQGLGLAVPIDAHSKALISELVSHGRVRRAWLGIGGGTRVLPPRIADRIGQRRGVEVTSIATGSPAAASLQAGDILTGFGGVPVERIGDLQRRLGAEAIGAEVEVTYVRAGSLGRASVRPGTLRTG